MIDMTTRKPLQVWDHGGRGGTIMVPSDQFDQLSRLLDANHIIYWVDEYAIAVDDEPEVTFVTLSKKNETARIQELLDSIP